MDKTIKVATKEGMAILQDGEFITFSYRNDLTASNGMVIKVICEFQFENQGGTLMAIGPLNVISVTPGITIHPDEKTKKALEDIWH